MKKSFIISVILVCALLLGAFVFAVSGMEIFNDKIDDKKLEISAEEADGEQNLPGATDAPVAPTVFKRPKTEDEVFDYVFAPLDSKQAEDVKSAADGFELSPRSTLISLGLIKESAARVSDGLIEQLRKLDTLCEILDQLKLEGIYADKCGVFEYNENTLVDWCNNYPLIEGTFLFAEYWLDEKGENKIKIDFSNGYILRYTTYVSEEQNDNGEYDKSTSLEGIFFERFDELTREQITQLKELDELPLGTWHRKEKIIRGIIPSDAPRVTVEMVEGYIAEGISVREIMQLLEEKGIYPDHEIPGNNLHYFYWLDDEGEQTLYFGVLAYANGGIITHTERISDNVDDDEISIVMYSYRDDSVVG